MTVEEEIASLIVSNQFMSKNSKSDTRIAMDSDTACPQIAIDGMVKEIRDDDIISC